jgi:DNA-binding NtrC family response regulator
MESIPNTNTPVLVVDDDQGLLLSIKATMLSAGLPEPALVSDSRRVPELVKKYDFQLILLDLVMPHVGGLELLRQVRKIYPEIECVVVTAVDEAASAVKAMSLGAYDYLVKPLNSEQLVIVINHALERYNLKRELSLFKKKTIICRSGPSCCF